MALLAAGAGLFAGAGVAQAPSLQRRLSPRPRPSAGRAAYAANCMTCHQANLAGEGDALPLAGKTFMAAWGKRTTADLYNTIRTSMPYGNPGSLDAKTYASLVAFILQANGAKPGATAFTPATAVKISTIASGTVPADIQRGIKPAQAAARPARGGDNADFGGPPPSADNGAGMIRSFGQTMVGDIKNYAPVTDAMLTNPPDGDWLMGRGNYAGWSYSPLKQINTGNVHDLQLKWVWAMNEGGANETTPLVHNGIMFLGNTYNTIQALDAKTGELLWENRVGPAPSRPNYGGMRSIAVWGDKVYFAGNDAVLHALDARTGKLVWSTPLVRCARPQQHQRRAGGAWQDHHRPDRLRHASRPRITATSAPMTPRPASRSWKFITVALTGQPSGDSWGGLPDDKRAGAETWIAGHLRSGAQHSPIGARPRPSRGGATCAARAAARPTMPTPPWRWIPIPAS